MRSPVYLLRHLCLGLSLLAPCAAMAEPSAIYLVRHAEKMSEHGDPELTARGHVRAQHVSTLLARAGIAHVFSTPTKRTMQTAQPLAQQAALAVQSYDPRKPAALVEKIRASSGAVLVVGHSNTIPELVRLLGGAPGADIGDNEYDRLYQLTPGTGGAVNTVLFTTP
jgi:broad specificity phosphatase PhoE